MGTGLVDGNNAWVDFIGIQERVISVHFFSVVLLCEVDVGGRNNKRPSDRDVFILAKQCLGAIDMCACDYGAYSSSNGCSAKVYFRAVWKGLE